MTGRRRSAGSAALPPWFSRLRFPRAGMYLLVFAVAVCTRAAWGVYRLSSLGGAADATGTAAAPLEFPDEQQYWLMASNLWAGEGLLDELGFRATRMPLFPAMLAPLTTFEHGLTWAVVMQWLIGAAAAPLTVGLARALFARSRAASGLHGAAPNASADETGWRAMGVAMIAGLLVALDPFLVFSSSLLLTEGLFAAMLLALLWAAAGALSDKSHEATKPRRQGGEELRSHEGKQNGPHGGPYRGLLVRRWLLVGLLGGGTIYAREAGVGLVVPLIAMLVLRCRFERYHVRGALLAALVVVLMLFPWALRNRLVTGSWCWTTHRAGISLYDGVRPRADGSSDLAAIQAAPELRHLSEAEWNHHFLRASWRAIRDDPIRVLRLAGLKLARMWNPIPNVETYRSPGVRLVAASWSVPVLAFAVAGAMMMIFRRGPDALWGTVLLLLPAVYLSAVHSVFVGSVRYRLPAMPMLEILAAVAVVSLWQRVRRGPREPDAGADACREAEA